MNNFRICPKCFRAVPARAEERFCANDGTRLLERCVRCDSQINSPFSKFCVTCGLDFSKLVAQEKPQETV